MKKFDSKLYARVAASATGVSLMSASSLEAVFSGPSIGPLGVEVLLSSETDWGDTNSEGERGVKRSNSFGFDAAGNFALETASPKGMVPVAYVEFKTYSDVQLGMTGDPDNPGQSVPNVFNGRFAKIDSVEFSSASVAHKLFDVGDSIGPGDTFSTVPFAFAEGADIDEAVREGPLDGTNRGIVGFRLGTETEGSYRYGWFDMQVEGNKLTVFGFGLAEDADTAVNVVPEVKHAALLLGLGAAGMATYRRRRRAA